VTALAQTPDKPGPGNPDSETIIPDRDVIIRRILGIDSMSKNVCLIDSHQMVNAADLPGRLLVVPEDVKLPSSLLRFNFRKAGSKTKVQTDALTAPVQNSRVEAGDAKSGALLSWFGGKMEKTDIAELRTVALPATSLSVEDLDEEKITAQFKDVPEATRQSLAIVTDVIPYEVFASVCKLSSSKLEGGVWYIRIGKEWYAKQTDELRRYYLVAVYTPLAFYGDTGVLQPDVKSSSSIEIPPWEPPTPTKSKDELLRQWVKAHADAKIFRPLTAETKTQ
jgi:hypothetical protein